MDSTRLGYYAVVFASAILTVALGALGRFPGDRTAASSMEWTILGLSAVMVSLAVHVFLVDASTSRTEQREHPYLLTGVILYIISTSICVFLQLLQAPGNDVIWIVEIVLGSLMALCLIVDQFYSWNRVKRGAMSAPYTVASPAIGAAKDAVRATKNITLQGVDAITQRHRKQKRGSHKKKASHKK